MIKNLFVGMTLAIAAMTATADPVEHKAAGSWDVQTGTSPDYWAEKGLWIDVLVENIAYSKVVGVVWTDNNWQTNQVSYLSYEYTNAEGKEQWGIDFAPLGRLDSYYIGGWNNYITATQYAGGTSRTIEYAIFYEVDGETYWDNNDGENYEILLSL